MTIQGGEWNVGSISGSPRTRAHQPASPPDEAGSYGITILSAGNSGGGVGDFGVFQNEALFTVYIEHG